MGLENLTQETQGQVAGVTILRHLGSHPSIRLETSVSQSSTKAEVVARADVLAEWLTPQVDYLVVHSPAIRHG